MSTPRIPAHIVRRLAHRMARWSEEIASLRPQMAEQMKEASIQIYAASEDLEDARAYLTPSREGAVRALAAAIDRRARA